jgi:hypothetical protein
MEMLEVRPNWKWELDHTRNDIAKCEREIAELQQRLRLLKQAEAELHQFA